MRIRRSTTVAIVLFTAFASVSFAANGPLTLIGVTPNSIQWRTLVPSDEVTLTISGPDGETVSKTTKGQALVINFKDLGGAPVDGSYNYELVITPPIAGTLKEKLKQARKDNDEATARKLVRDAGLNHPLIQSGAFAILNGAFVSPDTDESKSAHSRSPEPAGAGSGSGSSASGSSRLHPVVNDQVIPDDLIVQGSACVGLDCVNNESFGFDTIRLKENNTRIKFDDTSTLSGFPANDWQLTANDSASGGSSKFSIEDITGSKVPFTITAGAATNSIFADSTGRIGLRTSTPVLDIHTMTGNTPALRLDQNSTSGFTAQTWDVAGNEANFFVRDVTGGSRLPFRIRPGAPTSSIDINASGNVGIGTASPSGKLHVVTATNGPFIVATDGNVGIGTVTPSRRLHVVSPANNYGEYLVGDATVGQSYGAVIDAGTNSTDYAVRVRSQNGTDYFAIRGDGNIGVGTAAPANPIQHSSGAILTAGGVWQNASSREGKQEICALDSAEAREALVKLDPVKFVYKVDRQEQHVGFIAEEVPDLVASKDRKSLSPMDIVAVLTKVVQEQQKTIEQLSRRVEQLEKVNP